MIGNGLSGQHRLIATSMELDAAAGGRSSYAGPDLYSPAILGPAFNTDWSGVLAHKERLDAILAEAYDGKVEHAGTNWIRLRWHAPEQSWRGCLSGPVARLRAFDASRERFSGDEIAGCPSAVIDERRTGDEEVNRARLTHVRPSTAVSRLRRTLRLKQLFREWKDGNNPRPQSALEYEAVIDDFIDFAGDVSASSIDADLLYGYHDEGAKLPATMPRADRSLPFRARLAKHERSLPKCAPATLKKRVGALQALLTYAFHQR